jgi:hypothetical protein
MPLMDVYNYFVSIVTTNMTCTDGINLVGAAIGNGEMDYVIQEQSYTEYAYAHGLIPLGAKRKIDRELEECMDEVSFLTY